MKLLTSIVLAALTTPKIIASETSEPMKLSLVTRTNDATGKPIVRFHVSSTSDARYYYYYLMQVPKGSRWEYAAVQTKGAASAHTLNARETATIDVTPPRGATRWRLQVRYKPYGTQQDAYIKSEEIVEP